MTMRGAKILPPPYRGSGVSWEVSCLEGAQLEVDGVWQISRATKLLFLKLYSRELHRTGDRQLGYDKALGTVTNEE